MYTETPQRSGSRGETELDEVAMRLVGKRDGATGSADVRRLDASSAMPRAGGRVASLADRANDEAADPAVRPFSAIGVLSRREDVAAACMAGDCLRRGEGIVLLGMRGVSAWVIEPVDAVESGDDAARDGARGDGDGSALDRRAAMGDDAGAADGAAGPRRAGLTTADGEPTVRRAGDPKR